MLHISPGEVNCGFHVGFPAGGWHCFPCTLGKQRFLLQCCFGHFPYLQPLQSCHNGSGILQQILAPDLTSAFPLLTFCGIIREPQSRGVVQCTSSFQLARSRWEQEMRSSDKDCMCWLLCHKFIWMPSCCVYARNQSSSHFRSTICFMFGISIAFGLSPVAAGIECIFL